MTHRNPRRAYDKAGSELVPMTLADMRESGARSVYATCDDCQHHAVVGCDALPADLPVPDLALRLRCQACGSRRIAVQINMSEVQAAHRRRFPPYGSV